MYKTWEELGLADNYIFHKVMLNEFLKCVEGIFTGGDFSAILEKEIRCIKDSKKWRKEYMYMELLLRDERKDAIKTINLLTEKLLEDDRMEDLKKSLTDEEYQENLLKEYGLI